MWPNRVSNPGPLTYESGVLLTALLGQAFFFGGGGMGSGWARESNIGEEEPIVGWLVVLGLTAL